MPLCNQRATQMGPHKPGSTRHDNYFFLIHIGSRLVFNDSVPAFGFFRVKTEKGRETDTDDRHETDYPGPYTVCGRFVRYTHNRSGENGFSALAVPFNCIRLSYR